jgi:hypothetical protein
MKSSIRWLLSAVLLLGLPYVASADLPGMHPFYLNALSDLRAARWLLEQRPADSAAAERQEVAVVEIDRAIQEIHRAAINDGKDVHDHTGIDAPPEWGNRLRKAIDLLKQVRAEVDRKEDDPIARDLRNRAGLHIDLALIAAKDAAGDER